MGFSEEEFAHTLKELDDPDIEDYDFFVESHNVKVFRKYCEVSGLYQYKVIGEIDVDPEISAKVYMDLKYRKTWDSYAIDLRDISDGELELIYWEVAYPWPMSHRDYVYIRQNKVMGTPDKPAWVILGRSVTKHDVGLKEVPEKNGVIRVDDFVQGMAITSDGKGGTKAFMHYYDDPKGSIPKWLINWAASNGVPDFLSKMQTACHGYKAYLANADS